MPLPVAIVTGAKKFVSAAVNAIVSGDVIPGYKVEVFDPATGLWKEAPSGVGVSPAILRAPDPSGSSRPGADVVSPTEWLRMGAPGALPAGGSQGPLIDRDLSGTVAGAEIARPSASQGSSPAVFIGLALAFGLFLVIRE